MNFQLLNPSGTIALQQRDLMITAIVLMLIVAIPMLFMGFYFPWKYRASNAKSKYTPNQVSKFPTFWWGLPALIIVIIALITFKSTHALDPHRSIQSDKAPINIQVVAMRWKWLFIYPDLNIASVNFFQFPENTPVHFQLTGGDAPMNSFWIPQLGGQIYAMNGMSTNLNLMADKAGEFPGYSAEISGEGFAGMNFMAKSSSNADFNKWIDSAKGSNNPLSLPVYNLLEQPSENNPKTYYSSVEKDLYDKIIMKFMSSQNHSH